MRSLFLCLGLLVGTTSCLTDSVRQQPSRLQPQRQPGYPHYRPAQHHDAKPYKPKTWRERAEKPKPAASSAPAAG